MAKQSRASGTAPVVLAIDIGTSSVRSLFCDAEGSALADSETQIPYSLRTTQDGAAEFDPAELVTIVAKAIVETLSKHVLGPSNVVAVGVTSFWHSLLGLDAAGDPATPIYFWADSRSDATIDQLRRRADWANVRQRTGCRLHSSYWPAKLFWLRETDPKRFASVTLWVSFTEFLSQQLTGKTDPGMSISMASGTGLLDVHSLAWDDELLALLHISSSQLPRLIDVTESSMLGTDFAGQWPELAEVPWIPALGDGACANVGSGAIDPSRIALTLGTSGAMRIVRPAPVGADWPVPDGLWAYRLDREHAVLGGALSNGGNVHRWLAEITGTTRAQRDAASIAGKPPDGHGLTILPFIAGERSPGWHPNASGVIAGLRLSTTAIDLVQAALEAVAYRFARIYDELRPIAAPDHQIVGSGGAIVSSPVWTQIIASALGHEILALPAGDEATARGAALIALRVVGLLDSLTDAPDPALQATPVPPDDAEYPLYLAGRQRQQELENLVFPSSARSSALL